MPTRAQLSESAEHEAGHTELMRAALKAVRFRNSCSIHVFTDSEAMS